MNLFFATLLALGFSSASFAAPAKQYVSFFDLSQCSANQDYRDGNAACQGGFEGKYKVTVSLIDFSRAYPAAQVENTSYQGGDIDTQATSTLDCQFTYSFPVASVSMEVENLETRETVKTLPQVLTATKVLEAGTLSWIGHKKEDCVQPRLTGVTDLEISSQTPKALDLRGKGRNLHLYLKLDNYKISGSILTPKIQPEVEVLESYNITDQTPTLSWTAVAPFADSSGTGKYAASTYRTQGTAALSPKN